MRVGVTGGRGFTNEDVVFAVLDQLHMEIGVSALIEGEATGADEIAKVWAIIRGVTLDPYPATQDDWDRYGNFAGRVRNARMLSLGKPDLPVWFEGRTGTADMVDKCTSAGVTVIGPFL